MGISKLADKRPAQPRLGTTADQRTPPGAPTPIYRGGRYPNGNLVPERIEIRLLDAGAPAAVQAADAAAQAANAAAWADARTQVVIQNLILILHVVISEFENPGSPPNSPDEGVVTAPRTPECRPSRK